MIHSPNSFAHFNKQLHEYKKAFAQAFFPRSLVTQGFEKNSSIVCSFQTLQNLNNQSVFMDHSHTMMTNHKLDDLLKLALLKSNITRIHLTSAANMQPGLIFFIASLV